MPTYSLFPTLTHAPPWKKFSLPVPSPTTLRRKVDPLGRLRVPSRTQHLSLKCPINTRTALAQAAPLNPSGPWRFWVSWTILSISQIPVAPDPKVQNRPCLQPLKSPQSAPLQGPAQHSGIGLGSWGSGGAGWPCAHTRAHVNLLAAAKSRPCLPQAVENPLRLALA